MTSAQTMLSKLARRAVLALIALGATTLVAGCTTGPRLTEPHVLRAPYDTSDGEPLWAVIPLRNESGTRAVDPMEVSDAVVAAVQEARGVRCLPLNRTLEALDAMGHQGVVRTPAEAQALAVQLGVDGIIAGSITAWDPYDPPVLGLSLALYARDGSMSRAMPNPRVLSMAYAEPVFDRSNFLGSPVTVVSEHLDARNHRVLIDVQGYALGRSDPTSALNWRIHTASMGLYTRFAAYHAVGRILQEEWRRLSRTRHAQAE